MSYEGFEQHICSAGHLFTVSCSYSFDDDPEICHCGKPSVWRNCVDQTNGEDSGYIPESSLTLLSPKEECTCSCCGNKHLKNMPTYKVPTKEEKANLQTYRNEKGELCLCKDYPAPTYEQDHYFPYEESL